MPLLSYNSHSTVIYDIVCTYVQLNSFFTSRNYQQRAQVCHGIKYFDAQIGVLTHSQVEPPFFSLSKCQALVDLVLCAPSLAAKCIFSRQIVRLCKLQPCKLGATKNGDENVCTLTPNVLTLVGKSTFFKF